MENLPRNIKHKLIDAVERLNLDLQGKVVLTEAATGAYVVTPVIAAMAGAKVYAFAKSSSYGTVEEVFDFTDELCSEFSGLKINYIDQLLSTHLSEADLITNSGHLRPLNKEKLQHIKPGAVISLMYEAWEIRMADIDAEYCRARKILIGATNERHPSVDVFNYLGDMALRLIFDAGACPYKNKFVLICNNDFGPYIAKVLSKICFQLGVIDLPKNRSRYPQGIMWLSDFPSLKISQEFADSEAIIFTAGPFEQVWFARGGVLDLTEVAKNFVKPLILRYAGDIDAELCRELGIEYYPEHVKSGHMGVLPSDIGFDPIIRLQSGGLKVGELLLKGESSYQNVELLELIK